MSFEKLGLNDRLLQAISKLGFTNPTDIQRLAIPHIVKNIDVIGESATGSGKTLAFGCGVIQHTVPGKGLQSLVLCPTRELAEQVRLEIAKLSPVLKVTSIYGGVAFNPQAHELIKTDVVVATPGRLLDHMGRGTIDLSKISLLILDEADRMLDMGFIDDVKKIIHEVPSGRQTLFFSATISHEIRELANDYMVKPVKVSVNNFVDPKKLKQVYFNVPNKMKLSLLVHLLKTKVSGLVMVFCNTRKATDFLEKNLRANHIRATAIHGGISQNKRNKTIEMFDKASFDVLVCTDVAARGIHVDNVSHVINYDIPKDPKDYVHRIGRTARAGEEGKVINLLCDYDFDSFSRIYNDYDFNIQEEKKPYVEMVNTIQMPRNSRSPRNSFRNRSRAY